MKPVCIDIFFPVPEGWGICTSCEVMMAQANLGEKPHERGLDEYPPEWQDDFKRLSSTVFTLAGRFQDKVQIRIWDPRSLQGMLRSIRHGVHRYPTFIVDGKIKILGWESEKLDEMVQSVLESDISAL